MKYILILLLITVKTYGQTATCNVFATIVNVKDTVKPTNKLNKISITTTTYQQPTLMKGDVIKMDLISNMKNRRRTKQNVLNN